MREQGITLGIQPASAGYSRAMVGLISLYSLAAISPLWHVVGVGQRHILLATFVAVVLLSHLRGRALSVWVVPMALLLFGSAFAAGVYWAEPRLTFYPMYLVVACLLLAQATPREISRYVDVASSFMLVLVIGGVIGLLLARMGITPPFHIPNVDGRPNYFFYTTFTNAYWSGWIQAAGIYDEPGAFSFVICSVAFLRHITGRGYRMTWLLLGLGMVTFSLAHVVFMAIFGLSQRLTVRRLAFLAVGLVVLLAGARAAGLHETYRQYLFARVTIDAAHERGFDARLQLARNAAEGLRTVDRAALFGVDSDCTVNYVACREKWDYMGENPLAPLAHHGLLLAWPYYLFLALGAAFVLSGRRNLAFLAFALLFLQRPYVIAFGYSFLAVLALWLQLRTFGHPRPLEAPASPGLSDGPAPGGLSPAMADA